MNRNLILIGWLAVFAGCGVSPDNFPEPDKLAQEIINSLTIPVNTGDTLVYQPFFNKCGTWEDGDEKFYDPALEEQPWLDLLKSHVNKTVIICPGDSAYNADDKFILTVTGKAVSNNSVTIFEQYGNKKEGVNLEKLFTYEGEKWTCSLVDKKEFTY